MDFQIISNKIPQIPAFKDAPTDNGVTLLQLKSHSLLSYTTLVAFVILIKVSGKSLKDYPEAIMKLAELRIVLEKIKPLEAKLKYQIDKLVKAAAIADDKVYVKGQADAVIDDDDDENSLMFAPNPSALVPAVKESASQIANDGIYRPPRIAPQRFMERDKTKLTKTQKKTAKQSKLLADLATQYSTAPEEQSSHGTGYGSKDMTNKLDKQLADKEEFEEDNFLRPNLTRADKRLIKSVAKRGALMRFQDEFQDLNNDYNDIQGVERAVIHEEARDSGTGLLGKANKTSASLKRKHGSSAVDLIATAGKEKTADVFSKKLKGLKRAAILSSRKSKV